MPLATGFTGAEYFNRTTDILNCYAAHTFCFWIYPIDNAASNATILSWNLDEVDLRCTTDTWRTYVNQVGSGSVSITYNTWQFVHGIRASATDWQVWVDNVRFANRNADVSAISTPDRMDLGRWGTSQYLQGYLWNFIAWNAALTSEQAYSQRLRFYPVTFSNLWGHFPLEPGANRAKDRSGRISDWSTGGSFTDQAAPSVSYGYPIYVVQAATGGTDDLEADDLTTGEPVLDTPALTHIHVLAATGLTTGAPTLGTPAIGQVHVLSATGLTTGQPALDTPAIAQTHNLSAADLTTGAPTLDAPAIGQVHGLTVTAVTTGAPALDMPVIGQVHDLAAADLTTGAPVLGTPAIVIGYNLAATGITTDEPVFSTATLGQIHALQAGDLTLGQPVLGAPALAEIHVLVALGITTGTPALGTPAIETSVALTATDLMTGAPVLGMPLLVIMVGFVRTSWSASRSTTIFEAIASE